jgi:hypothetical protein
LNLVLFFPFIAAIHFALMVDTEKRAVERFFNLFNNRSFFASAKKALKEK